MKLGIDWSQNSTKRGVVWLIAGIIGIYYSWGTHDVNQLLSVASAVAGGLGVGVKD
ncbi:hypothetical protein [Methylomonas sp. 11b]|uniref:hypothetical protein n=1 Tax=Methylomonas sp. 11b TaxID=1168169 RepID=UPI0004AE5774|nr:hypothetical protein [Methylomonas sp. 11b]